MPFNIASYALLTMMIAQVTRLKLNDFVHTLGDTHIYHNHFEQAKLQLTRKPKPLPFMRINPEVKDIFGFTFEDFELVSYEADASIERRSRSDREVIDIPQDDRGRGSAQRHHRPRRRHAVAALDRSEAVQETLTTGKPVIMGRKTYDSIGKPLPGRPNVVISRSVTIDRPDQRASVRARRGGGAGERLAVEG